MQEHRDFLSFHSELSPSLQDIVIITSIAVAATAAAISSKFGTFSRVGGIIGTSVSAGVLILLGVANAYILWKLVQQMRNYLRKPAEDPQLAIRGHGCMFQLLQKLFKLMDRSWKIIWLILIFPVLFTAGMCLLDTIDGALMMTLYTSTALANDRVAILYYSIVLTTITIVVAVVIGFIQLLSLILNVAEPTGKFWDGVAVAGDHYDVIGGAICGSFLVFGALSVLLYKPWRRWFDEHRRRHQQPYQLEQAIEQSDVVPEPCADPDRIDEQRSLPSDLLSADHPDVKSSRGTGITTS
ncbi:MAG: hypothetical protein Q9184_004023 [Pyrenodesmia sp. 2 TL-2023]